MDFMQFGIFLVTSCSFFNVIAPNQWFYLESMHAVRTLYDFNPLCHLVHIKAMQVENSTTGLRIFHFKVRNLSNMDVAIL